MTSPEPEEETTAPPPGYPQSPQAVAIDEALEQAESSIIPTLAALLAAEVATSMVSEAISETGENVAQGAYRVGKGWRYPFLGAFLAGKGVYLIIKGMLELLLLPLGVFAWNNANDHADRKQTYSDATYDLILDAIDEVVERVAKSVEFILAKDVWDDDDIYALFGVPGDTKFNPDRVGDDEVHGDPRSATQRAVDNFARQMARWLTRETVFTIQERVARGMGFTHKRWITMHDHKVRDFHRPLHGKAVPLGQSFSTPVGDLRYPGDTSAPIGLWINCRCVIEWIAR